MSPYRVQLPNNPVSDLIAEVAEAEGRTLSNEIMLLLADVAATDPHLVHARVEARLPGRNEDGRLLTTEADVCDAQREVIKELQAARSAPWIGRQVSPAVEYALILTAIRALDRLGNLDVTRDSNAPGAWGSQAWTDVESYLIARLGTIADQWG